MTRFSEAKGRKIVGLDSAETVGKVDGFVVDPTARAVHALKVKKADDGDTLRWSDLVAFGVDAVTVAAADRIAAADPTTAALGDKHHEILGKRVLTTAGDDIGKVSDVEFDPQSSAVVQLYLDSSSVDGQRLIGIGSYAVVVQAV